MNLFNEISESMNLATKIYEQGYDNLFSANHRNRMIEKHGATSAQWITIEELLKNYLCTN